MRSVVFGASGGIGSAIAALLEARGDVHRGSRSGAGGFAFDLKDEASIAAAADELGGPLDLVFVATGILSGEGIAPEKSLRGIDAGAIAEVMAINTIGPALIGKHFLPLLAKDRRAVFAVLSARVGSISDNRLGGWHSYRASKAALNMIVQNFAIELARSHPQAIAVSLHPGTVDTGLSEPFQRGVPGDKLFTPKYSAQRLCEVLDRLTPEDSGGLFAWDGQRIAY